MKNLQDATTNICRLKGEITALQAMIASITRVLSSDQQRVLREYFADEAERARALLLGEPVSEHVLSGLSTMLSALHAQLPSPDQRCTD